MIQPWTDELIKFLNELHDIDPVAVRNLIGIRVACNEKMANHPTVQVGTFEGLDKVGLLGILNGFCGVFEGGKYDGQGPIAMLFENRMDSVGDMRFVRTDSVKTVDEDEKN